MEVGTYVVNFPKSLPLFLLEKSVHRRGGRTSTRNRSVPIARSRERNICEEAATAGKGWGRRVGWGGGRGERCSSPRSCGTGAVPRAAAAHVGLTSHERQQQQRRRRRSAAKRGLYLHLQCRLCAAACAASVYTVLCVLNGLENRD